MYRFKILGKRSVQVSRRSFAGWQLEGNSSAPWQRSWILSQEKFVSQLLCLFRMLNVTLLLSNLNILLRRTSNIDVSNSICKISFLIRLFCYFVHIGEAICWWSEVTPTTVACGMAVSAGLLAAGCVASAAGYPTLGSWGIWSFYGYYCDVAAVGFKELKEKDYIGD